jgi:hypothetical protein
MTTAPTATSIGTTIAAAACGDHQRADERTAHLSQLAAEPPDQLAS